MRSETLARSSSGASFRTGCTRKESRVAGTEFDGRPICAPAVAAEKNIRDAAATRIVVLLFIYGIRKEMSVIGVYPSLQMPFRDGLFYGMSHCSSHSTAAAAISVGTTCPPGNSR